MTTYSWQKPLLNCSN